MNALHDRRVSGPHPDGTYTITSDWPGDVENGHVWTLRDTGSGWEATHPRDAFTLLDGTPARWQSAEDAAEAVLRDPAYTVLYDGRRFGEVAR